MSNRVEIFLDKYKELEAVIKLEYNLEERDSAMGFLLKNKAYHSIRNELDLCRETRNLLSHNPRVRLAYIVEPSEAMIKLLEDIIDKVKNPLRARDIMVKKSELYYGNMNDGVRQAMIAMSSKSYSHIPIMDDDVLVGVFSSNTLLSILIDEKLVSVDDDLKFKDIEKYLYYKNSTGESYRFISKKMPAGDISDLYKAAEEKNDRIGMMFVTENGNENEKVLGIITAWDLASEAEII